MGSTDSHEKKTWLETQYPLYFKGAKHSQEQALYGLLREPDTFTKLLRKINKQCVWSWPRDREPLLTIGDEEFIQEIRGRMLYQLEERKLNLLKEQAQAIARAIDRIDIKIQPKI